MNKYEICPADYRNKPIQVCLITQKWKKIFSTFSKCTAQDITPRAIALQSTDVINIEKINENIYKRVLS